MFALEVGIMGLAIVMVVLGLYFYVRFSPKEKIPPEYFFKVREPQIRRRRENEAKAKKSAEENQVDLWNENNRASRTIEDCSAKS